MSTAPQANERRRTAEVRLTDETIEYLEKRIAAAVEKGIKESMTEDTAAEMLGMPDAWRLDPCSLQAAVEFSR